MRFLLFLLQGRVAGGCCQPQAPEEPCVRVSPHTAQASEKVSLVGIPANPKVYFTLLPDRQNGQWHAERTTRRHHLLSLLSSDSNNSHVTRDPLNVSLLTEPGMLHSVSRPLQPGIRFFQHPLRLACPTRRRRNWVPTFRTVDPMDDLGAPFTPVVLRFRAGS